MSRSQITPNRSMPLVTWSDRDTQTLEQCEDHPGRCGRQAVMNAPITKEFGFSDDQLKLPLVAARQIRRTYPLLESHTSARSSARWPTSASTRSKTSS